MGMRLVGKGGGGGMRLVGKGGGGHVTSGERRGRAW